MAKVDISNTINNSQNSKNADKYFGSGVGAPPRSAAGSERSKKSNAEKFDAIISSQKGSTAVADK